MSISVRYHAGRYLPTVTCDTCGNAITDAQHGVAYWHADTDADTRAELLTACRGSCAARLESKHDHAGAYLASEELVLTLYQLTRNAGMNRDVMTGAEALQHQRERIGW